MAGAIALACVLASATPAVGEPRLTQQNLHPQQSAGIIPPPPVNPPPRVGTREQTGRVLVWSWPSEGEPRRNQPNSGASRIVPLTLKYGSQPPVSSSVIPAELATIRATWEPPAPPSPFLLKLTAGGSIAAPPYLPAVGPHAVELAAWAPGRQSPPVSLDIAALLAIPGTQVPPLVSQLAQGLASIPPWQQPPSLVTVAGRLAIPGTQVPAVLVQPQAVALWLAPPAPTRVAALIPPPAAATWVALSKPSTPASVSDVLVVRMPSVVATLAAPVVSPVVAFTRARVPVALEWIAPSTLRVVTQGAAPAQTPYTRALIVGASLAPMEQRAVSVGRGVASLLPSPVVSAPDIALLGEFVQIVVPAMVSLAAPPVTVALLAVGATVALATPAVAVAITGPGARIIPAPSQTSRPDP